VGLLPYGTFSAGEPLGGAQVACVGRGQGEGSVGYWARAPGSSAKLVGWGGSSITTSCFQHPTFPLPSRILALTATKP
jgi:hypothetical protein